MRREPSEAKTAGDRGRARRRARSWVAQSHLRRLTLESLERRALMATAPASVASNWTAITSESGTTPDDDSAPVVAVDPLNPLKMVVAYTNRASINGTIVYSQQAESTSNGGLSWTPLFLPGNQADPTSSTGAPFSVGKAEGVGFDRNENAFIGVLETNSGANAGTVRTEEFGFSGSTPTFVSEGDVYDWDQAATGQSGQPAVVNLTLAVDNNDPSFTDPNSGQTQTDPNTNFVYIAWTQNTPTPSGVTDWNPYTVGIEVSTDSGATWQGAGMTGNFGPQRDTAPRLAISQGEPGTIGGDVTLLWDDFGSGANASPVPVDLIDDVTLAIDNDPVNGLTITQVAGGTVATPTVRGALDAPYPLSTPDSPIGVGPGAEIAVDNTLGSFSQFSGRIYVTYVDRYTSDAKNPADNTDIFLTFSDDQGATWSAPVQVNDDDAIVDGHTGAVDVNDPNDQTTATHPDGRTQFEPSIAVDPATGVVALSWLDSRDDATDSRYADYVTTSIDGGQTFSPDVYANPPDTATDAITGKSVVIGPYLDNQSSSNAQTEGTTSFGEYQALAIAGGVIHPIWASTPFDAFDKSRLSLETAQLTYPDGPRIISGTSGPVQPTTIGSFQYNNTIDSTGTEQADGFVVTYDEPVDVSTFGIDQVQVFYHDTKGSAPVAVPVLSVTPIDEADWFDGHSEATEFLVKFRPSSGVGTYTYSVGPSVSNRVRTPETTIATVPDGTFSGTSTDTPMPIAPENQTNSLIDITAAPATDTVSSVTVTVTMSIPNTKDLLFGVFSPSGNLVLLANLVGNGPNFINTTFSDTATIPITSGSAPFSAGPYQPDQPLAGFDGGPVDGQWQFAVLDESAVDQGQLISWSISIGANKQVLTPVGPGSKMDQNADGRDGTATDFFTNPASLSGTPLTAPFDTTTLPIIVPGPHVVNTFVSGQPASSDNLVLNATVPSFDFTFDRDMNPASIVGTYDVTASTASGTVISMIGPLGPVYGEYVVTADPQAGENPLFPKTYKITLPAAQSLSGTYTLSLGAGMRSEAGDEVDSTLRAGVAVLFGTPAAGTTAVDTTYTASALPLTIPAGQSVTSTITVPDSYLIYKDMSVALNITYPNDPDLVATLTGPDGTTVVDLFSHAGNIGTLGSRQNFTNTILSDTATTSIENGSPPFYGQFDPQQAFSPFLTGSFQADGTWTLTITNDGITPASTGTLNSWSLTLGKPSSLDSGLGDPVADRTTASFRIFTMDPTNPLSSNTWTAVGPAANNESYDAATNFFSGNSSRIDAITLDPSDPTGNTAYVAGASGGIWKTTDFLTMNPNGPTYVPLTSFGPSYAMDIDSIAVYGRNNDPNQSIIVAATGEGDASSPGQQYGGSNSTSVGVGFLISYNGGQTWTLMDSTHNVDSNGAELPESSPLRDHIFVGSTAYKVIVDPNPTPSGGVIIYAALNGNAGQAGVWRSVDSGRDWTLMRAGDATDVTFDPDSGTVNAISNPTGNLDALYAAFVGDGVYYTPNQGQTWDLMAGGTGDPLVQDPLKNNTPIPLGTSVPQTTPSSSANGRIVLAHPDLTGDPTLDRQYETWLYAAVSDPSGHFTGLYMTKDNGLNWTDVRIPDASFDGSATSPTEVVPSNDTSNPNYNITGGQGTYDIAIAVDPNDPSVVYIGGSRDGQPSTLIRVDTTLVSDPYAVYTDPTRNGGGTLENTTSPVTIKNPAGPFDPEVLDPVTGNVDPDPIFNPFLNLYRDPYNAFGNNATVHVTNTKTIADDGSGADWTPFTYILGGETDVHRILAIKDPATGLTRVIVGLDQGVFSGVDDGSGGVVSSIGTELLPTGSRNGNLQINQIYNGAVQPSDVAASIAGAMFYGMTQDNGFPQSDPNILTDGNIKWSGIVGDGTDAAVDETGSGTSYFTKWPCCINDGSSGTDFFKVRPDGPASVETGRTFGLIQTSGSGGGNTNPGGLMGTPDPQWPYGPSYNFAVNPIAPDDIIIGSGAGRLFGTETQGEIWYVLANPSTFDGTIIPALAYGAPDPNGPGNPGAVDNYMIVGTNGGHIYVTFTGGGGGSNPGAWINISTGLDGASVERIVTDPTRGTHDAYAITTDGVFYNADTSAANTTWVNVTGNLLQLMATPFGDPNLTNTALGNPYLAAQQFLAGLAVDWRYVIPNTPGSVGGATHPMLYVDGEGGVFRSTNNGQTWSAFPDQTLATPAYGGALPSATFTDLNLSLGDVDPTTGHAVLSSTTDGVTATGPNLLVADTYGRGAYAIRLAPIIFDDSSTATVGLSSTLPAPGGSDTGKFNNDGITDDAHPFISGLGEQTAYGNKVAVTIELVNADGSTTYLGGYNPAEGNPATSATFNNPANETDAFGNFNVQISQNTLVGFNGKVNIEVFATDQSGTRGNVVDYSFTVLTVPPATPAAPVLEATSDTGRSSTDGTTSDNLPTFDVSPTEDNSIVELLSRPASSPDVASSYTVVATANVPIGTPPGTPPAFVPVASTTPVPDGQYYYAAIVEDLAGNVSSRGPDSKLITIDTVAPVQPPAPVLAPSSDTGVKGDDITADRNPTFDYPTPNGSEGPPTETILLRGTLQSGANAVPVGNNITTGLGTTPVQDATVGLPDGTYYYFFEEQDLAGNTSVISPGVKVQILSTIPATPPLTLAFDPADDSSHGLLVTNVTDPRVYGSGPVPLPAPAPGYTLDLINKTTGAVIAGPIADPNTGSFIFNTGTLAQGTYTVYLQLSDVAGNTEDSKPITFTIKTTAPTIIPTLQLVPSSIVPSVAQTASAGKTTARQPSFYGTTDPGTPSEPTVVDVYAAFAGQAPTLVAVTKAQPAAANGHPAGYFQAQLPFSLNDGTVSLYAVATDVAGNSTPPGPDYTVTIYTAPYDFTAAGHADIGVYRPSTGYWYVTPNTSGSLGPNSLAKQWGTSVDIPLAGDYDGDGKDDYAVFQTTNDMWYISRSTLGYRPISFGIPGLDVPVPGVYDTSGVTDVAVYRPSTGYWYILHNLVSPGQAGAQQAIGFGFAGLDQPAAADYEGKGYEQLGLYRPTTGQWLVFNQITGVMDPTVVVGGQPGDVPVPGDYDGIGRAEPAVYQPATATTPGEFLIYNPITTKIETVVMGGVGDVPVPADYLGTGRIDPAVWTPSTGTWTYENLATGKVTTTANWGLPSDIPIEAPYSYKYALEAATVPGLPPNPMGGGGPVVKVAAVTPAPSAGGSKAIEVDSTPTPAASPAVVVGGSSPGATSTGKASVRPNVATTTTTPVKISLAKLVPSGAGASGSPFDVALDSLGDPINGRFFG